MAGPNQQGDRTRSEIRRRASARGRDPRPSFAARLFADPASPNAPAISAVPTAPTVSAAPATPNAPAVSAVPAFHTAFDGQPGNPAPNTSAVSPAPVAPTVSPAPVVPTVSAAPVAPAVSPAPVVPTVSAVPVVPTVSAAPVALVVSVFFALFAVLGLFPFEARAAHYVLLKSGSELTGEVLKETPRIVFLDLGFDVLAIPREDVQTLLDLESATARDGVATPTLRLPGGAFNPETGGLRFALGALPAVGDRSRAQIIDEAKLGIVLVANPGGSGSGFLLNREGEIVTNYHVVRTEKYHAVTFFTRRGRSIERRKIDDVELVAINPLTDLALLRIDPERLREAGVEMHPLPLTEPGSIQPGDPVFAIGNPGVGATILEQSVSEGIVSSAARNFNDLLFIQTTAAVNPGNSGGPLLDAEGRVVGVVTLKAMFQEGIAFASPIRYLLDFLEHRKAYAYDARTQGKGFRYLRPE